MQFEPGRDGEGFYGLLPREKSVRVVFELGRDRHDRCYDGQVEYDGEDFAE